MVITWDDALADREARGEARGKALGKAEGRKEGKLEGLRSALASLLRDRFGLGSGEVEARLQGIENPAKLQELFDQAIKAQSLEELRLAS